MAVTPLPDDDLVAILSEQRREISEAKALVSDLDYAFQIQMQEALNASLALGPSSSSMTKHDVAFDRSFENDDVLDVAEALLLSDMDRCAQEVADRERCVAVMRTEAADIRRRIHDQHVAADIESLPEDYWSKYGDWYEKPYAVGFGSAQSSSSSGPGYEDSLRLYFKGLVSEERFRETNVVVAGAGVAICDPKDNILFYSRKNLEALNGDQVICSEVAELEALIEGLNKAVAFGFTRVEFLCFDHGIYRLVTELRSRNAQIATLLDQVVFLQKKFTLCHPTYTPNATNFAFKSAREAVVSQINWSAETSKGKRLRETCVICFEDTDVAEMFSINGCLHRYCFSCMKQHVEMKLHNGKTAKCPHDGCNTEVAIDSCAEFLPPNLVEVMGQRMKESAIPVTQKVYCPVPNCSALMSQAQVLTYTKAYFVGAEQSSARKCMKCEKFFCLDCKVPWHYNLTCNNYRIQNPNHHGDEQMLKHLAMQKLWRQCTKCSHMVELLDGCYHITCRCGYEFCYTCGAEWKNKKATCACPIWDERNIIRDDRRRQPRQQNQQQQQQQQRQRR